MYLHTGTHFLLFPWKLAKNCSFRNHQKICRRTSSRYSGVLAIKTQSFLVKQGLKVCIFKFPWQPFQISKFWQHKLPLWPRQIVRARFRCNRSRNRGVVSNRKSVRDCLHVCPRLPACVFSQIIVWLGPCPSRGALISGVGPLRQRFISDQTEENLAKMPKTGHLIQVFGYHGNV